MKNIKSLLFLLLSVATLASCSDELENIEQVGAVYAKVALHDGTPVSGQKVYVDGDESKFVYTMNDGTFFFANLSQGNHKFTADLGNGKSEEKNIIIEGNRIVKNSIVEIDDKFPLMVEIRENTNWENDYYTRLTNQTNKYIYYECYSDVFHLLTTYGGCLAPGDSYELDWSGNSYDSKDYDIDPIYIQWGYSNDSMPYTQVLFLHSKYLEEVKEETTGY